MIRYNRFISYIGSHVSNFQTLVVLGKWSLIKKKKWQGYIVILVNFLTPKYSFSRIELNNKFRVQRFPQTVGRLPMG